jgi:hypothetical protein
MQGAFMFTVVPLDVLGVSVPKLLFIASRLSVHVALY